MKYLNTQSSRQDVSFFDQMVYHGYTTLLVVVVLALDVVEVVVGFAVVVGLAVVVGFVLVEVFAVEVVFDVVVQAEAVEEIVLLDRVVLTLVLLVDVQEKTVATTVVVASEQVVAT